MHSESVIYRKQALNSASSTRIAHEAAVLRLAAHPNVVEVVSKRVGVERASLRLAGVNGSTLAEGSLEAREFGLVILGAAATLAHLHELGIAHNRMDATHIIVRASDGTPVLCGFAEATTNSDNEAKAEDVIALGRLLRERFETHHDALRARINGVVSTESVISNSLRSVADMAIDGEISGLQLAEALRAVLEDSPVSRAPAHTSSSSRSRLRTPLWVVAAAIVPLALISAAFFSLSGNHSAADASTPARSRVAPCAAVVHGATAVDTDGDGCPNSVFFGPGSISVDGEHYAVGGPNDQLLIGDWQGTGLATLALLQPASGDIYLFDSWPVAGKSATPRLLTNVPGASKIADVRTGHHDSMVVTSIAGTTTVDPTTVVSPIAPTTTTTAVAP